MEAKENTFTLFNFVRFINSSSSLCLKESIHRLNTHLKKWKMKKKLIKKPQKAKQPEKSETAAKEKRTLTI